MKDTIRRKVSTKESGTTSLTMMCLQAKPIDIGCNSKQYDCVKLEAFQEGLVPFSEIASGGFSQKKPFPRSGTNPF